MTSDVKIFLEVVASEGSGKSLLSMLFTNITLKWLLRRGQDKLTNVYKEKNGMTSDVKICLEVVTSEGSGKSNSNLFFN